MVEDIKCSILFFFLRGLLVYLMMVLYLDVGWDKLVQVFEQVMMYDYMIFLVIQQDILIDELGEEDIFIVGIYIKIKQMLKFFNGMIRVFVEGIQWVQIFEYIEFEDYILVDIQLMYEDDLKDVEDEVFMWMLLDYFDQYIKIFKKIFVEMYAVVIDIEEFGRMVDIVVFYFLLKLKDKQDILEMVDIKECLNKVICFIYNEKEVLEIEKKIGQCVKCLMECI